MQVALRWGAEGAEEAEAAWTVEVCLYIFIAIWLEHNGNRLYMAL